MQVVGALITRSNCGPGSRQAVGAQVPRASSLGTHARVSWPLAHGEPSLLRHAWSTSIGPGPVVGKPARSNTRGTGVRYGKGLAVPRARMAQPRRRVAGPYSSRNREVSQRSSSGRERRLSEELWSIFSPPQAKRLRRFPPVARRSNRAARVQLSRVIPYLDKGPLSVGNSLRLWTGCLPLPTCARCCRSVVPPSIAFAITIRLSRIRSM